MHNKNKMNDEEKLNQVENTLLVSIDNDGDVGI